MLLLRLPFYLAFALLLSLLGLPPSENRIQFVEVSDQAGVHFRHENFHTPAKYLVETMGSGAAFLDFDRDGQLDLYLVNGAPLRSGQAPGPGNRLYRNRGDGRFEDVTQRSGTSDKGYGMGVAVGDIDNDGWPDLYVTNFGRNVLFHNLGNGTFEDISSKAGVDDPGWGASAGFFDYDRDGHLDLYVTNYLDYSLEANIICRDYGMTEQSYCHPDHFPGASDLLYRNKGDGTFENVSRQAGIANPEGKGLGVTLLDLDRDGWTDIYVANDSIGNFLYRNNRNGTFTDVSLPSGTGFNGDGRPEAGMGVDADDITGDGFPELLVTNLDFESNTLYVRQGDWLFEDQTSQRGLAQPGFLKVGFGTCFLDFDNDSDLDLFVANGHILDNISLRRPELSYPQANNLYSNEGGIFRDISESLGSGLALQAVSRGVACGDYDNDGDLDLLVNNCNQGAHLLRNEGGNRQNWVLLELEGVRSNRDGAGTAIEVEFDEKRLFFQRKGGGSYLSANDHRIHISVGSSGMISRLRLRWPSGVIQELKEVGVNRVLKVREPEE